MKDTNYEIEIDESGDEPLVRIISDDEGILNDSGAMDAVLDAVRSRFGPGADTVGRGCSDYVGSREDWVWSIKIP